MYYKFLDKRHAQSTIAGNMRFGRLRYYQLLEIVTGDSWIGDRREGLATTRIDIDLDGRAEQAEVSSRLADAGFMVLEGQSSATIRGGAMISEVDCFVFCVASGELEELVAQMCSPDRAKYAYDGCIRLTNPSRIVQRLWARGTVDGQPLRELFSNLVFGQVRYDWKEHDIADGPAASGDPFVKHSSYSKQSEWRFALFPRQPIEHDSVTVSCDIISRLLVSETLNVSAPARPPNEFEDVFEQQLVDEISSIWRTWRDDIRHLDDRVQAWEDRQMVADQETRRAVFRKSKEMHTEGERDLAARFIRGPRTRLLKVYFEWRHRQNGKNFSDLDKSIVRGLPPGLLSMAFERALPGCGR